MCSLFLFFGFMTMKPALDQDGGLFSGKLRFKFFYLCMFRFAVTTALRSILVQMIPAER